MNGIIFSVVFLSILACFICILISYVVIKRRLHITEALLEITRELCYTDSMTGLYNRRYWEEVLSNKIEIEKRHGRDFSVIFIDINDLHGINKNGHHKGDDAIVAVAECLASSLRESDILARWGGDEFAVLAEGQPSSVYSLISRINMQMCSIKDHVKVTVGFSNFSVVKNAKDMVAEASKMVMEKKESLV